jgi:hypothetical protein
VKGVGNHLAPAIPVNTPRTFVLGPEPPGPAQYTGQLRFSMRKKPQPAKHPSRALTLAPDHPAAPESWGLVKSHTRTFHCLRPDPFPHKDIADIWC